MDARNAEILLDPDVLSSLLTSAQRGLHPRTACEIAGVLHHRLRDLVRAYEADEPLPADLCALARNWLRLRATWEADSLDVLSESERGHAGLQFRLQAHNRARYQGKSTGSGKPKKKPTFGALAIDEILQREFGSSGSGRE